MRAHVMLPDELVEEIDKVVGRRKRSRFVEEAIREKLRRGAILSALKETAGILSAEKYSEWETPDKVAAWVRESRQHDMDWPRRPERG